MEVRTVKRIFKNQYVFSLFTKGLMVILGMLNSVFINRFLGPELKGQYSYILNIVNIAVLFLNLGIYQSYPYFKRKKEENNLSKFIDSIYYQFFLYMLIALLLSVFYRDVTLIISFTLIPLMTLTKQVGFVALVENTNMRNLINTGSQLFYTILLFGIFLSAPQNILFIFISLYIKDIILILWLKYKFKFKFSFSKPDFKFIWETIKFGLFPMLTSILVTLNYQLDVILLRAFVDFEQIGFYTVGVGLANKVWVIPDAFKDVLFSKTSKGDPIKDIAFSVKLNLVIGMIFILFIVLLGRPVLYILYGAEYLPAYAITAIISIGLLPMMLFKLINPLFIAKGKQKLAFIILLSSVILNAVANVILIPIFGINGAGIASVMSYFLSGFWFGHAYKKMFDLNWADIILFNKDDVKAVKRKIKNRRR